MSLLAQRRATCRPRSPVAAAAAALLFGTDCLAEPGRVMGLRGWAADEPEHLLRATAVDAH